MLHLYHSHALIDLVCMLPCLPCQSKQYYATPFTMLCTFGLSTQGMTAPRHFTVLPSCCNAVMTLYTVCDLCLYAVWRTVSLVHSLHGKDSYCTCTAKIHFCAC